MQVINNTYELTKVIGHGAHSTIYLAEHLRLHTRWAVKELPKYYYSDLPAAVRILQQCKGQPLLPYTVGVLEEGDFYYIIEEYIEGVPLSQYVLSGESLADSALQWMYEICQALLFLHNRKPLPVFYRELCPDNILRCSDGSLKLLDFGLETTASEAMIPFLAPEQKTGAAPNPVTDIYSLGATFRHLLQGQALSEELVHILDKCTQEDPRNRYPNCEALQEDLLHSYRYRTDYHKYLAAKRTRRTTVVLLLASALLSFGAGTILHQQHRRLQEQAVFYIPPEQENYENGLKCYNEGRYEEAVDYYTLALDSETPAPTAYFARGDAYYALAQMAEDREVNTAETEPKESLEFYQLAQADYQEALSLGMTSASSSIKECTVKISYLKDLAATKDVLQKIPSRIYQALQEEDLSSFWTIMYLKECSQVTGGLSAPLVYQPTNNAPALVLYPDHYIYYGEYQDGLRQGSGTMYKALWTTELTPVYYTIQSEWSGDLPNGTFTTSLFVTKGGKGVYLAESTETGYSINGIKDGTLSYQTREHNDTIGYYDLSYHDMEIVDGVFQTIPWEELPSSVKDTLKKEYNITSQNYSGTACVISYGIYQDEVSVILNDDTFSTTFSFMQ